MPYQIQINTWRETFTHPTVYVTTEEAEDVASAYRMEDMRAFDHGTLPTYTIIQTKETPK